MTINKEFINSSAGFAKLTQEGANIEAEDNTGRTPLLMAAESGSSNCVHFLLEQGADPRHRDAEGRNFIHLAILNRKALLVKDRLAKIGARNPLFRIPN